MDNWNPLELPTKPLYSKTPNIKEMLESLEPISPGFIESAADSFGARWREAIILFGFRALDVDRIFIDYLGTKEVMQHISWLFYCFSILFYFQIMNQILTKFFMDNPDKSTIGWFTTFLWKQNFREVVLSLREPYKQLIR